MVRLRVKDNGSVLRGPAVKEKKARSVLMDAVQQVSAAPEERFLSLKQGLDFIPCIQDD